MKSSGVNQKNIILFCGLVKTVQPNMRSALTKIQRVLMIDLNGGQLYQRPLKASGKSVNKDKQLNKIDNLEQSISSFPILPEHEIYQISDKDSSMNQYLKKLGITWEKGEYICQYCNTREPVMFPIFFQSKNDSYEFHRAVLCFQLYHRYYPGFEKLCRQNNLSQTMNMRLISNLANSMVLQDFVVDPEDFSVVKLQDLELQMVKDCIQRVANRLQKSMVRSSISVSQSSQQISSSPFSLRLRFKIVDTVSINYLRSIVSDQTMRRSMRQFDVANSGINDGILSIILIRQQIKNMDINNSIYANLVILNLNKNQLTDLCFISLGALVACTPLLRDLNLSGNLIKLRSMSSIRKQEKQNNINPRLSAFRLSAARLSAQLNPSTISKSEPFFIQFLQNVQFQPINYINLDNNLIEQTQVLVTYIIEGSNVPVRYLSARDNKFSEVDKIRMAKLIISQVQLRGDTERLAFVDFGHISIVDEDIFKYVVLLKEKNLQLDLNTPNTLQKPQQNFQNLRRSSKNMSSISSSDLKRIEDLQSITHKVSIRRNKEWQLCDQEGILDVSNLYKMRRKTEARRSQIMSNILMGSSLSPSSSSASLHQDGHKKQQYQVTAQTFKPTVNLLKQAYLKKNYSAIRLYKQVLKEYNMDVYNKKIFPLFFQSQKQLKKQQEGILKQLSEFINMERHKGNIKKEKKRQNQNAIDQNDNDRLDVLISRLLMRRIEFQVKERIILYEGDEDEEEWIGKYADSVLLFLLYLRIKRDQIIDQLIAKKINPAHEIHHRIRDAAYIQNEYYINRKRQLCQDNYMNLLRSALTKNKQQGKKEEQALLDAEKESIVSQKQLNELVKSSYLRKCKSAGEYSNYQAYFSLQQKNLCYFEPKLMFTGYLIKYYSHRHVPKLGKVQGILQKTKCQLLISAPSKGEPISKDITNFLQFISRFNMLSSSNPCLNPTLSTHQARTAQCTKLAVYNPAYEGHLNKFSELSIAFVKFLQHSPNRMLAESVQYINFLISMILSEQDSYNIECLANQFYLQLFTFNADTNPQIRARQVNANIIVSLVEFMSYYMGCSQILENYVRASVLACEIVLDRDDRHSHCRMIACHKPRYQRKEDQLPASIVSYIFSNPGSLQLPITINYWNISGLQPQIKMQQILLHMHILTPISQLLNEIEKSGVVQKLMLADKQVVGGVDTMQGSSNWGLFIRDNQSNKVTLLLPSNRQRRNIYSLLRNQVISYVETGSPKKQLVIQPLVLPFQSGLQLMVSQLQIKWYYLQIYQAFREYGSFLSLISPDSNNTTVNVTISCIACHILVMQREKIQELALFQQQEWKISLKYLCEEYSENANQYAPKGMGILLTGDQATKIQGQLKQKLQKQVTKLRRVQAYYSQLVQESLCQLQHECRLIIHPTCLHNPISQQQLVFTCHGLLFINRIIYAEAVYWKNVLDIKPVYNDDLLDIKAIQIIHASQQQNNRISVLKINVGVHEQQKIFINGCLIMIKNYAMRALMENNLVLQKFMHAMSGLTGHDTQTKPIHIVAETKKSINIWQQLENHIEYIQTAPKTPVNLQQNKQAAHQYIIPKQHPIFDKQQDVKDNRQDVRDNRQGTKDNRQDAKDKRQDTKDNRQDIKYIAEPTHSQEQKSEYSRQGVEQARVHKQEASLVSEQIKQKAAVKIVQKGQIDMSGIIKSIGQEAMKKDNQDENAVITNARRSSRRQLPKRRSRDK